MNKKPETIDISKLEQVTGGCGACGGACGTASPQGGAAGDQRTGEAARTGARSPSQM